MNPSRDGEGEQAVQANGDEQRTEQSKESGHPREQPLGDDGGIHLIG